MSLMLGGILRMHVEIQEEEIETSQKLNRLSYRINQEIPSSMKTSIS